MSFKRKRGRRKLAVRWLEDASRYRLATAATSAGVLQKAAFPVTLRVSQLAYDPSESRWLQAAGERSPNVRSELLEDPGWRMIRLVGDWPIALKQAISGPESAVAAVFVKVFVGLALLPVDADGVPDEDFMTRATQTTLALPETATEIVAQMEGGGFSWIWKRTWMLQNFRANLLTESSKSHGTSGDMMSTSQVWTGEPAIPTTNFYKLGFSANTHMPSPMLNHSFDIKAHVTVKPGFGLFWILEAVDMQGTENSYFELLFVPGQSRMLIAKPGRWSKRLEK